MEEKDLTVKTDLTEAKLEQIAHQYGGELDAIFAMQKMLNKQIRETRPEAQGFDRETWMQKQALALIEEVMEVMNEINYKWWKNPKPMDDDAMKRTKEELVDVLHFFVSMCLEMGMTAHELFAIYVEKNRENFARQAGTSEKKGYALEEKEQS